MLLCIILSFFLFQDDHQSESAHSTTLVGEQAAMFKDVSDELICQCGCSLVLSQCGHVNCPSAIPMRKKIEEMVIAGQPKDSILAYFMNEYSFRGNPPAGKAILSEPDRTGFDLVAWITPFAALIVFGMVVLVVVKRRLRSGPHAINAREEEPHIDSRLNSQIEKELRNGE